MISINSANIKRMDVTLSDDLLCILEGLYRKDRPLTGARIETDITFQGRSRRPIAPLRGRGLKRPLILPSARMRHRHPPGGARIKTQNATFAYGAALSPPSGGDSYFPRERSSTHFTSKNSPFIANINSLRVSSVRFPGPASHLVICSGFFPSLRANSALLNLTILENFQNQAMCLVFVAPANKAQVIIIYCHARLRLGQRTPFQSWGY